VDVSVVIPCFKEPRWENTIRSIESQIGIQAEAIVVDGSATPDFFSKWDFKIPVTFIHEQDAGVYDAMNKGIAIAQGKWILILGANDHLASDSCLNQLPLELDVDLILCEIENIDKDHALTPSIHRSIWSKFIYWKHTLHQQGVLYNRRCFLKNQFQIEYKILGDYAFHLQLRTQNLNAHHTDVMLSKCDGNGLSKQFNWGLYAEELKLKKQHLSLLFYWIQIPWVAIKFLFKKMF